MASVVMLAAAQLSIAASIPLRTLSSDRAGAASANRNAVRITFRQLYFPPARKNVAVRALATLRTDPESSGPAALADHEVLPSRFDNVTIAFVSELLGRPFAEAVQKLPVGRWVGPVRSELGWHLLWVDSVSTERTAASGVVQPSSR